MRIAGCKFGSRRAWELDNGKLRLVMLQGGGHIASVALNGQPSVNPLWRPVWRGLEPWEYKARHEKKYGLKLQATIAGHNLCLGWFGEPSDEEAAAGMGCHGEASIVRWRLLGKKASKRGVSMTCGCEMPVAQMGFRRTLTSRAGSNIIHIKEQVRNLSRRDVPFTMCQHVTVGPPFLEKGVTLFDMPATKAHTFPDVFGDRQRLKTGKAFKWPDGPGARGETVDMRLMDKRYRVSGDFSTQLMDPARSDAWFSAVNPKQGLMLAYAWKRDDFPWVGNWEENYGRKESPWNGKSLTRGMEFANTPFPVGLRRAVDMGEFLGEKTYRWLPAKGKYEVEYDIILEPVPPNCKGVADIRRKAKAPGFVVNLLT